MHNVTLAMLFA